MKNIKKLKHSLGITNAQMKYIAFISMFIDHFNKVIIGPKLDGSGILLTISTIFDIVGRIAFPIFAFMIVEGFMKTRSRTKYLRNLLIFALISEIPYDLFQSVEIINMRSQNVMFSLALGLLMLIVIEKIAEKIKNKLGFTIISLITALIFAIVAIAISSDYDYHAILVIYVLYIFYDKRLLGRILAYLVIIKEIYSALGFGITLLYNGKKGKQNKLLNYLFYPTHLLVLGLVRVVWGM